ncbi:MAG: ArgE/DapE family deacylase [Geodermatophilaceae bacterium]|nr:ArgE/DapE family deacylase [Geodermatophilaceae bacterium]
MWRVSTFSTHEQRLLDAIDAPWALERLVELIAIPSITGSAAESEAQHLLATHFDALGLNIDLWAIDLPEATRHPDFPGMEAPRTEAWGLVGTTGGDDGPTLILNGHVDVVPPGDLALWKSGPFQPTVAGDVVHGRGACDMKAGVVAALVAAKALQDSGLRLAGTLALQSVVSEEDGGLGAWATLRRGHRGDAAVLLEPTSGSVHTAGAGALTFRIEVTGRAAHGATRDMGVSAFEAFWPIHLALRELETERNLGPDIRLREHRLPYSLSVGTISAGDWPSSVPDRLVAEGRYGVVIGEPSAAARKVFEERVVEACKRDPWLADHPATVSWSGGQFGSGQMPTGHPLLGWVQRAAAEIRGHAPPERAAAYGSDLRLYAAEDIPTVHFGPGDVRLAHSPREKVELSDLISTAQSVALLILRTCGVR